MSPPLVLVTGAHGFLGSFVARAFPGWTVHGLGHGPRAGAGVNARIVQWFHGDVTLEALRALPARPELIVHCAGSASVGASMERPMEDFERTVTSTMAVLEFARLERSIRVVLPSSGSVYGARTDGLATEADPTNPASIYAVHKRVAEELCAEYARFFDVPIAIVRFFSIYGPELRKQLIWDACVKFREGQPSFGGTGDEVRDFLHVRDAAALLAVAATHAAPSCPVVNGGTGIGTSVREIVEEVGKHVGPGCAPAFSGADRPGNPSRFVADISRARAWGWEPTVPWREGVRSYCDWFLEHCARQ